MPKRVVIVGAGFGGAYCAHRLERTLRSIDADVLALDRKNYFTFTPFLLEAGTGAVEPRHAVVPIRSFMKHGEFRMAEVHGVDLVNQRVSYRQSIPGEEIADTQSVEYDHLVLALGSVTKLPPVPGLHEYGFELKGLTDAVSLRDRAVSMLEIANATSDAMLRRELLHFVVVGANFTGAELAGEFDVFLRSAARRHYPNLSESDCRVTLIELADRILGALDPKLSDYALRTLRKRGIDIRLRTTVEEVERRRVILNDGTDLATRTVIWCAGIEPSPLIEKLDLPVDERGYILCERDLRVKDFENVWAIGDSAVNIDSTGRPYPATAQHAVAQGRHLAKNLALALRGRGAQPCELRTKGTLAALGGMSGVAQIGPVRISGFLAWWLWRTVYLLKIPTFRRKLRIALDWTVMLFFRNDVVQLGILRPERHIVREKRKVMMSSNEC